MIKSITETARKYKEDFRRRETLTTTSQWLSDEAAEWLDTHRILKELNDFIAAIVRVYQKQPILYIKYDSYEAYVKGDFESYNLWIQDRFFYPKLPEERKWMFWQYSNRGRV